MQNKLKSLTILVFTLLIFPLLTSPARAFKPKSYINYTVPVRHLQPSQTKPLSTLDLPTAIHKQATHSATPVTWLIDHQVLSNPKERRFFEKLSQLPQYQIGLLLEVSPSWRQQAKVPSSTNTQTAYLLNSYSPTRRRKLIDSLFNQYFQHFNTYPKTVAASYIDSTSLSYVSSRYSVNSAVFNVNHPNFKPPDISGRLPFFPYYPGKNNALVPAQSKQNRIPLVITHFNPPDLSYTDAFSLHNQLTWPQDNPDRFYRLLSSFSLKDQNEHTQLTFGVDNSTSPQTYLPAFRYIQKQLKKFSSEFTLQLATQAQAGARFISLYPFTGPAQHYRTQKQGSYYLHYVNPFYQLSLKQDNNSTRITQLTVFNNRESELFAYQANLTPQLKLSAYPLISSQNPVNISLQFDTANFTHQYWDLNISSNHNLRLEPYQIISSQDLSLPTADNIKKTSTKDTYTYKFDSTWSPFSINKLNLLVNVLKLIALIMVVLALFKIYPTHIITFIKNNPLISLTLLLGTVSWSLTTVRSGSLTKYGLSFWRAHSHDSFFHLSLIESFKQSLWPLHNPNLSNTLIHNYHLAYDYALAILSRFLHIPAIDLYFRLIPPLMAAAIGYLSYKLIKTFQFSKAGQITALILLYTAGSLGFIPHLIHTGQLFGGQSAFWAHQSIETLINPPFTLSLIIILAILNLLQSWQTKLNLSRVSILSLLISLLSLTKVYAWLLVLSALCLIFITRLVNKKPLGKLPVIILLSLFLSALFLLPIYQPSGQLPFQLQPLWFIRTLFSSPDRLNWPLLAQKWQDLTLAGSFFKAAPLYLFGIIIFYLGNLGIRLFALPKYSFHKYTNLSWKLIFFITYLGLLAPLLLIQPGNSWNAIQFLYYPLFFTSLFAAPVIVNLLKRTHNLPLFVISLLFLLSITLPTTVGVLKSYLSPSPSTRIDHHQLRSLYQLKNQSPGLVLSPPFQLSTSRSYASPPPAFSADSTAYIPALTGQPSALSDQVNLQIMSYPYQDQLKNIQRFYNTANPHFARDFIGQHQVKYITQTPTGRLNLSPAAINIDPIFDSPYYPIYTISR